MRNKLHNERNATLRLVKSPTTNESNPQALPPGPALACCPLLQIITTQGQLTSILVLPSETQNKTLQLFFF